MPRIYAARRESAISGPPRRDGRHGDLRFSHVTTAPAYADEAPTFVSRDSATAQAHATLLFRRNLRFEPLANGCFEARLTSWDLAQSQLVEASYPGGALFFTQDVRDDLSIFLVRSGTLWFGNGSKRLDCPAGSALAINTALARVGGCLPGTNFSAFTIQTTHIAEKLKALFGPSASKRLDIATLFDPSSSAGAPIAGLMATALEALRNRGFATSPQTVRLLQDTLITMVLEALPHNHADRPERRAAEATPWQIRQAIGFIAAHAHEPLTVSDVAAAAGIGLRSLQQGFRRYRQTSPNEYIKATKLSRAREELLSPSSLRSIEEVARHWGFGNRGHFATEYRRAYGELPSQTRRAR